MLFWLSILQGVILKVSLRLQEVILIRHSFLILIKRKGNGTSFNPWQIQVIQLDLKGYEATREGGGDFSR